MLAWIIYYQESARYNEQYIKFYIEEGKKLGIDVRLILVEELEFGVVRNHWFVRFKGNEVQRPDFVINRAIYPLLSRHLEYMGIRVFNNSMVSELCNDKAKTYQYLAKTGITMVDSSFYRSCQTKDLVSKLTKPTVIKAVDGHGGSQVFLAEPKIPSDHIICGIGSCDIVVQPLVGSKHQDLRVYVIGKEVIAAVLRTAREGFKSNFSLGGEVCLYELKEQETGLVDTIISQFDFGLVGIDFIIGDEGELIFNEIEDVVGSRMLYQCSDINIVAHYLTYIKNALNIDDKNVLNINL